MSAAVVGTVFLVILLILCYIYKIRRMMRCCCPNLYECCCTCDVGRDVEQGTEEEIVTARNMQARLNNNPKPASNAAGEVVPVIEITDAVVVVPEAIVLSYEGSGPAVLTEETLSPL